MKGAIAVVVEVERADRLWAGGDASRLENFGVEMSLGSVDDCFELERPRV